MAHGRHLPHPVPSEPTAQVGGGEPQTDNMVGDLRPEPIGRSFALSATIYDAIVGRRGTGFPPRYGFDALNVGSPPIADATFPLYSATHSGPLDAGLGGLSPEQPFIWELIPQHAEHPPTPTCGRA